MFAEAAEISVNLGLL